MNTERIEAAAKAGHRHVYGDGHFDYLPDHTKDRHRETISAALAAADAVMFSDEAVEVAEELLREKFCVDENMGEFDATAVWGTPADIVATVVAALRGEA